MDTVGSANPPRPSFWKQNQALLIVLPFVLVALLIVATQYSSYQLARYNQLYTSAMAEGRPQDAIEPLQQLIARTPSPANYDYRRKLAQAHIEMGEYESALQELKKLEAEAPAIDLNEPMMISHYELATQQKGSRDPDALTKKSPSELEDAARGAKGGDLNASLMESHFELGQSGEGRQYLDALLARSPLDPAANFYLARVLINEGKYAEAGRALRVAGTDAKWDKRAEPVRKELAAKVFGPGNEEGDLVLRTEIATSPTRLIETNPTTPTQTTPSAAAAADAATSQ